MIELTVPSPHMKQAVPQKAIDKAEDRQEPRDAAAVDEAEDSAADEVSAKADDGTDRTQSADIIGFEGLLDALYTPEISGFTDSNLPVVDAPPIQTPLPGESVSLVTLQEQLVAPVSTDAVAQSGLTATTATSLDGPALLGDASARDPSLQSQLLVNQPAQTGAKFSGADQQAGFQIDFSAGEGDMVFHERAALGGAANAARGHTVPQVSGFENSLANTIAKPASLTESALQAFQAMSADAAAEETFQTLMSSSSTGSVDSTGTSTMTARAAADPAIAHRAVNTAGLEIARAAIAGRTRFDIKLDPPELGRIEVRMIMDKEKVQARMMIEKPETLDLMMRDRSQLERLLAASGVDLAENGLEMELKQHDGSGQNAFADMMGDEGRGPVFGTTQDDATPATADPQSLIAMNQMQIAQSIGNPLSLNRMA